jgi:hypothetical protein
MTKAEAEAIQVRRTHRELSKSQKACEHKNQELDLDGHGLLPGHYRCPDCGELVKKPH